MVADLISDVHPAALGVGMKLRAHTFTGDGFLRDMGTPARLERVERYLEDKQLLSRARTTRLPVKTVFLDRDRVINQDTDLLHSPDDFRLLPGVGDAVAQLNKAGLTVVVVTNQPVIARGLCTEQTLGLIHDRMARLLAGYDAHVDAIYFCPHHPETHHRDEGCRQDLRVACDCRKPAPGLLLQAARERDIDLSGSVLIGDRPTDIAAAKRAGVRSILLGTAPPIPPPDYRFATLPDAVSAILTGDIA